MRLLDRKSIGSYLLYPFFGKYNCILYGTGFAQLDISTYKTLGLLCLLKANKSQKLFI